MKKLLLPMLLAFNAIAFADVSAQTESQIRAMLPKTKISQINPGPFLGSYEVLAGDNAFYVSTNNESEIIVGHIVNVKTMQDVTQAHIDTLNTKRFDFKTLQLANALKIGNGKKKMVVFIDPDCPYCQQLEGYLDSKASKLTVYYMFMPLAMHPNALPHTKQILCSSNPSKAISEVMIAKQELPAGSASCQSKVEAQVSEISKYAAENGINSTPFIITDTNQIIGGFNIPQLQSFIEGK